MLPLADEFTQVPGFVTDPRRARQRPARPAAQVPLPGAAGAARRLRGKLPLLFSPPFSYADNSPGQGGWQPAVDYIAAHSEINEVILSGGDPLMAKDEHIAALLNELEAIPHLKRLRIHSRLPVVIHTRLTDTLRDRLAHSRLRPVLVLHINHANEIDADLADRLRSWQRAGITLLNQSVLLAGVNDDADALEALSERLFDAGVLPYYLHQLDRVAGAAHFAVSDERARTLMARLLERLPGFLVPRLVREVGGEASKTPRFTS
ncbi:KamA family radical SAM protein [Oceanimonas sp. NS1]|nr:KamA family radical SAM protein [Oceanimonas sp. NS1]